MDALGYLRIHAKEFSDLSDELVTPMITSASLLVNITGLDAERSAMATGLYAAHLLWIERYQVGGSRGPVTFDRDDKASRRYATVDGSDTYLGQSPYGMLYTQVAGSNFNAGIMTRFTNGANS